MEAKDPYQEMLNYKKSICKDTGLKSEYYMLGEDVNEVKVETKESTQTVSNQELNMIIPNKQELNKNINEKELPIFFMQGYGYIDSFRRGLFQDKLGRFAHKDGTIKLINVHCQYKDADGDCKQTKPMYVIKDRDNNKTYYCKNHYELVLGNVIKNKIDSLVR